MKPCPGVPLNQVFPAAGNDAQHLLMGTLAYDPLMRLQCEQVRFII
jgi:hypothetical protein